MFVMTSEAIVCLMVMMWLKIYRYITSNDVKCMNVVQLDFEKLTKLSHFISLFYCTDPANSYTHALLMHSAIPSLAN